MSGIQVFSPINGETVWLISDKLREYLAKHTLGYGLEIAGEPPVQLHKSVTLSWVPVHCALYTVAYGNDPKLQDAVRVSTDTNSVQITTLPTGKTCYWQVTAHTSNGNTVSDIFHFHTADSLRILVMEGADNARDLGGYLTADRNHRVAQGKIFRGNRLDTLTPEGLRTALDIYKIRTDLDLRNEKDGSFYNGVRSPLGDSVNYINIIGVQYDTAMRVTDSFLSELLVFTKPENYPVYIHCSAGRDRTGTLFFILGALLGIPQKDLLADYEITYLTQYAYPPGDTTGHDRFMLFWEKLNAYPGNSLQEKTVHFCKSIGLTDTQLQTIRDIMLEDI